MELALVLCAAVQFTAAMVLFGGSLFRLLLNRAAALDPALSRCLRAAVYVAWISAIGWLVVEAANFGNGWTDAMNPSVLWSVISDTNFGHLWAVRLTICIMLMFVAHGLPTRSAYGVLAGLATIFLASLSLTGHAEMDDGLLHPLNQAVHLLAGGVWIGSLLPLTLALWQPSGEAGDALAMRAVRQFAQLGYLAVTFVIISGLINSWFLVSGLHELFVTTYGRALIIKLVLVSGMLLCAAVNRFRLTPRLMTSVKGRAHLRYVVMLESLLALAVLGAASFLGTLQPGL
ncbi:MAG: copper homeostasis membrane protein CopD [Parvibaculaceae bacterium]